MFATATGPKGFDWFLSQAFGSDELTAYTAEYAWNSNQMAHAMMGFALAAVWLRLAISRWERYHRRRDAEEAEAVKAGVPMPAAPKPGLLSRAWHSLDVSTAVLFGLIPLKELADLLLDNALFAASVVRPTRWPLYFDSITDISFWWTGMFLAAVVVGGLSWQRLKSRVRFYLPIGGVLACVAFWYFYAAPVWLDQKRTFDVSGLPFNYTRLAVLAGEAKPSVVLDPASPVQWGQLADFRDEVTATERPPAKHYVILGGTPEQRSRLAVSMGAEFALTLRPRSAAWEADYRQADGDDELRSHLLTRVKYVSAVAGLERPQELLPLRYAECIIVDNLNVFLPPPGTAGPTEIVAAVVAARPKGKPPGRVPPNVAKQHQLPEDLSTLPPAKRAELNADPAAPRSIDSIRSGRYEMLGEKAKSNNIGTIWVLSGDRNAAEWEAKKRDWLQAIARILKTTPAELKLIQLAEPQ